MEKKKTRMTRIQIFLTEMSSNTEKPSLLRKKRFRRAPSSENKIDASFSLKSM